jgi:predicted amidohydrolase
VAVVKINFMGDVMLGELLENYRRGLRSILEKKGIDPFEHVRPVLGEADLNVVNLECVFSDSSILERPFSEILVAPESFVEYLVVGGIGVVSTANNHALDHGGKAFERSVALLRERGIHVIGYDAGRFFQEEPVVVETGGMKLGFLGYNISNFPVADRQTALPTVACIFCSTASGVFKPEDSTSSYRLNASEYLPSAASARACSTIARILYSGHGALVSKP